MQSAARRILLIFILWLMSASAAFAQDAITASGAVTTRADGLSVPGAVVAVVGADATATTDATGRYTLTVEHSAVHADRIQLKVDALGLPTRAIDVIVDGPVMTVDVALSL